MMLKIEHFGNQQSLRSVEMWCWRWIERISWTDSVKNEVLQRVEGERNILPKKKKKRKEG